MSYISCLKLRIRHIRITRFSGVFIMLFKQSVVKDLFRYILSIYLDLECDCLSVLFARLDILKYPFAVILILNESSAVLYGMISRAFRDIVSYMTEFNCILACVNSLEDICYRLSGFDFRISRRVAALVHSQDVTVSGARNVFIILYTVDTVSFKDCFIIHLIPVFYIT